MVELMQCGGLTEDLEKGSKCGKNESKITLSKKKLSSVEKINKTQVM